ncbi:hypothetical protein EYF80_050731 [Liparis tanakae]|uniref:Uncharacterized protein n=1 Tax=Liparis tanakae TaxID=230148 RepID=A0A4Z2FCY0_9TELE|nr:hypothetical protein EYF80_050731 [Liparis tanakae]
MSYRSDARSTPTRCQRSRPNEPRAAETPPRILTPPTKRFILRATSYTRPASREVLVQVSVTAGIEAAAGRAVGELLRHLVIDQIPYSGGSPAAVRSGGSALSFLGLWENLKGHGFGAKNACKKEKREDIAGSEELRPPRRSTAEEEHRRGGAPQASGPRKE